MATGAEIREAIVATIEAGCQRSASWFPYPVTLTAGNYPAGMVTWSAGANTYGATYDPTDDLLFDVVLHVRGSDVATANKIMDDFLIRGSGSAIVDLLGDDPTLGGLVMDITATGFDLAPYDGPDEEFIGRVHLRVMT